MFDFKWTKVAMNSQCRIKNFPVVVANRKEGANSYYMAKFSRKLHGNEDRWAEGEGHASEICIACPPLTL